MTRGTTPTYKVKFVDEIDFLDVETFYATLKQSDVAKVTRKDPEIEDNTLIFTLTQEETLKFKEGEAELQIRGKFNDGTAFTTKVIRVPVNRVLYSEVI